MKKLIIAIIFVSGLLSFACDDSESRYPGTLLQQAFRPECIENEAVCRNDIEYRCFFGRYRIAAPCSLEGTTYTTDAETCGGEIGKTVCCK